MDPVTASGLAISVASIGFQVYTGCIQGIQLLITARNYPEDCKFLNLRLRMEQQRLFAWSETSGLLDLDSKNHQKILESNTFILHRTTVLDLLVQVQCLFQEFQEQQKRYNKLEVIREPDELLEQPERDASNANFPLPRRRRDFIKKAMSKLKEKGREATLRLRWASFDKESFENLLSRFAALNDNMTDILDARLQVEIHDTVQDTNRGVLQLHRKISDLSRLVMALNLKLDSGLQQKSAEMSGTQKGARDAEAAALKLLTQLAKFKAFNATIESDKQSPLDEATAMYLELGGPGVPKDLRLDASTVQIKGDLDSMYMHRCEGVLQYSNRAEKRVWIEWKEYDRQTLSDVQPPKQVILDRVSKLAALLNHQPKPEAFRTPHCLGFFDQADLNGEDSDDDISNMRLGLVFERPNEDGTHTEMPPVSLRELLLERASEGNRKPRVTERVKLASAISNCLLSLHLANWLHKSLRSDNVIFFRTTEGHVDYRKPYISGFDFSRPAKKEEMTEATGDDVEHNLYRHPHAQMTSSGERERFKKSFDIYSLGIVLVEIAHWTTIDKVLGIDLLKARGRPSIVAGVQEQLLSSPEPLADVGGHMGEIYEKAVRRCVAGGKWLNLLESEDETNDSVAARLSMAFYENVVKALGSIVV